MKNALRFAAAFLISFGPPGTAIAAERYFPPPEANGGWRALVPPNTAPTLEQKAAVRKVAGLDWDKLSEAWKYTAGFGTPNSVLFIRHGWIAGEWRNYDMPRSVASSTKSITAIAMARLFELSDHGLLKKKIGLDDFAWHYLPPSWAAAEPARKEIRLRHLLTMTSGLTPYDGPYKDVDYESIVFAQTMEAAPGTVWAYASAPVDLLSCIIEDVTGRSSGDFFNEEISAAIGAVPARFPLWGRHSSGSGGPGGGVYYLPRELARVGYLLLQGGAWDQNRIISPERIALFTQWAPFLQNATWRQPNFGREPHANEFYGYLFWTNRTQQSLGVTVPRDAFYMSGWGKQTCAVIPSLDLIVVRLGAHARLNEHPEFYREFYARVMAAVIDRE